MSAPEAAPAPQPAPVAFRPCRLCRQPLAPGRAHFALQDCAKDLRAAVQSLHNTVVMLGVRLRQTEAERERMTNLLWAAVRAAGGELRVSEADAARPPGNRTLEINQDPAGRDYVVAAGESPSTKDN